MNKSNIRAVAFIVIAILAIAPLTLAMQQIFSTRIQPTKTGAAFEIDSQLNLRRPRFTAWQTLVSMRGMEATGGFIVDAADRDKSFEKLGDSAAAKVFDKNGRLVVTGYDKEHELRVVFEPDSGDFLIAKRFVVATAGEGSVLQQWMQYVDFRSDAEGRVQRLRDNLEEELKVLRIMIEK